MSFVRLSAFILIGFAAVMSSCGGGETASSGFYDSPSEDDGDGGTLDTSAFSVKVAAGEYPVTTILHGFYDRDQGCEVLKSSSSATYRQCLLNVRESDLFSGGLKLEFNAPPDMCAYTATVPYWFYNRLPGKGPSNITITRTAAGAATCDVDAATSIAAPNGRCPFPLLEGSATMSSAVKCAYDYSGTLDSTGKAGPNCCSGDYNLTIVQQNASGPDTITTSSGSYGGKAGNCVASPGASEGSGWAMSGSGFPATGVTPAIEGLNVYNTIKAPITLASASNLYAANFFGWTGYAGGTHLPASAPPVLRVNTDLTGDVIPAPHLPYTFACMDESYEVKHMIDVYVNEWDSNIEFDRYANRLSADPTSPACGPTPTVCNNWRDWKTFTLFPAENYSAGSVQ